MRILLGIASSIAAYKTPHLVRLFKRQGHEVFCALTENAERLVATKALETVSENRVITDMWAEKDPLMHIHLTQEADILLIAPATANLIGKIANGIADDALTTMAMAFTGRKYIAPAMNSAMWEHPATQRNSAYLTRELGYTLIAPGEGELACLDEGVGRLAELEDIVRIALSSGDRAGKTFIVTAGATREWIDTIRFISNRSSGKMGRAIAEELLARGATVIYIQGQTAVEAPKGARCITTDTTEEMLAAVIKELANADTLIMAAAPLDFRPVAKSERKIKKRDIDSVALIETPDILKRAREENKNIRIVAFAAETHDLIENATAKLNAKGADMIIANRIEDSFEKDDTRIVLIDKSGLITEYATMSKRECAKIIVDACE